MRDKINDLPIILGRKATFYEGVGDDECDVFHNFNLDDKVTLCSDGTHVEYQLSFLYDERRPPYSQLRTELDITIGEFMEYTQGEDTYVNIILVAPNKISISITTQHDVIYDEVHTIR